ncbi:hypothetical protein H5368_01255 [Luteimonas sp. MC1782]|uniref:hypothetical protein n=1 Tax=Luteimonas sp. MC1782 TaxID=2760305 RepID=UPI001602638E|nr:hypothetical protein [Luteimonas sp. MC1782]MBB1471652.1 hypothetical protein [Luteimonas sp. MC1782]
MDCNTSIFGYMYRDGGNFKTVGRLRLSGYDAGAEATMRSCLEWGNQFVAEQVGIPSLCREHWEAVGEGPSELDHAYHEFAGLSAVTDDDSALPIWGALESFVARMRAAARQWDVRLSPNCDL